MLSFCLKIKHTSPYGANVIHQVAQAGFPEEPPKDEQAVLIHAEFSDSAGPEKAPFSVFPLCNKCFKHERM
jgi:hypothetical protein